MEAGINGHRVGGVRDRSAQIGGIDQRRACRVDLGQEGVGAAGGTPIGSLQRRHCWKISGVGIANHIGRASAIYGNAVGDVDVAAAQIGGVDQRRTGGIQLGHEGVDEAAKRCLNRRLHGKAGGVVDAAAVGIAGHVNVIAGIERQAVGDVRSAPAQVGGEDQRGAGGVDLADEHVLLSGQIALDRVLGRKIRVRGGTRHIDITGRVHRRGQARLARFGDGRVAQRGGVQDHRIDHQRPAAIIAAHRKAHTMFAREHVAAGNLALLAIHILIHSRAKVPYLGIPNIQQ